MVTEETECVERGALYVAMCTIAERPQDAVAAVVLQGKP
jgi:hypothetical protein